jgi:predicted aspartyl protease
MHPPGQIVKVSSFSVAAPRLVRVLSAPVNVGPAFDPPAVLTRPLQKQYVAIWDTGATASVITEKVVFECGLKQISIQDVHTASETYQAEVYLISLTLPNNVHFAAVRVTKGKLVGEFDVLVGMDVITQGDFAVTNHGGKTFFSFRCPSVGQIDFTGKAPVPKPLQPIHDVKVGRNDPCPCGSGKKFKRCCGR